MSDTKNAFTGFQTKAIHVGQAPDPTTGAVIPPIYMTSTYAQHAPSELYDKYDYTRGDNPNFTNFENAFAALEHGKHAVVVSSGLAGLSALFTLLKPGDRVIAGNDCYGGTHRAFKRIFEPYGVTLTTIDLTNDQALHQELKKGAAMVLFETPSNPLLKIIDIQHVSTIAHQYKNVIVVADNTFATAFLQNPLLLGADIVWHSTTKYTGGHSDVVGGILVTNQKPLYDQLFFARMAMGFNPSPFDVWLAHRGLKTLGLRMERHSHNAQKVVAFLNGHPAVKKIHYPGLPSHPGHQIAKKQMSDFGGMVSVEFNMNLTQTKKLISSFSVFTLAESLGGVESLVDHPTSMTHASISAQKRKEFGIEDGLIRFSVGIENETDLIADLAQAIQKAQSI
jgi:cystathionine beta-lyase/cystathionine gamma-synthase